MNQRVALLALVLMLLTTGCQSLFLTNQSSTQSRWTNWDQVTIAFSHITPNFTTAKDLRTMGFDPRVTPNIKIMPYVDVVPIFMPNPNIRKRDLPVGVQVYFEGRENSCAYLVEMENVKEKRHGNIFLDVFGFKRLTHQSGWRFRGIILLKDNVVVYTLASGEPDISKEDSKIKPLGPFQELDNVAGGVIGLAH
jgi:hypothetical protein